MRSTLDVWTDPDFAELVKTDPRLVAIADVVAHAAPAARSQTRAGLRARYATVAAALLLIAAVPAVAFSRDLQRLFGFVSSPRVARNWVQATLTRPVPKDARAGTTVRIQWKLWSRDQHGKIVPFDAGGIFARIVNPNHTAATRAAATGQHGRYEARVRVPTGGIGAIQVGIMGWSSGLQGRRPAPSLFPITNYP